MSRNRRRRGIVATADGVVFEGTSVGSDGIAIGEAVFNTSMGGYQEIVTDPSYAGQVVILTAPQIGNYGAAAQDDQSDRVHARALITRSMSRQPSSWRSDEPFVDYLLRRGVIALSDIDTRRLTRHIRDHGSMPVAVGTDVDEADLIRHAEAAPSMAGQDLVSLVTTPEQYTSPATAERVGVVAAYDFGIKRDIIIQLNSLGLDVIVLPANTSAEKTLSLGIDGVFLSNGPGDPEPLGECIAAVRGILGSKPLFGICLGHQILGLALGASTFKLPFGHHGGNHPVRVLSDRTVDITSQNHGFAVDLWTLAEGSPPDRTGLPTSDLLPSMVDTAFGAVTPTHQNLNDGTNEGLQCLDVPAFSVQYHPEAAPGPHDAAGLFTEFLHSVKAGHA